MTLVWDEAVTGKVNEERTATLNFLRPDVRGVYIDWDDGESNKKTEANYQWATTSEPIGNMTVTHTYNKEGTFYPVVQTVNSKGFVSRYYSAEGSNTDIVPFSTDAGIASIIVSDSAPTALMRLENTTASSGIDNSILEIEGPKKLYIAVAPTLTRAELTGTIQQVSLEIEAVSNRNKFDADNGVEAQTAMGTVPKQENFAFDIDFTSASNQYGVFDFFDVINSGENAVFSKVLKMKYISCKATGTTAATPEWTDYNVQEVFNRLKIFLVVKANNGKYYPVAYVSSGSPVKSVEESPYYSVIDMGVSRAAASNATISDYRYDNGKGWFNPVNQWVLSTDILSNATSNGTSSTKKLNHSYLTNPEGLNNINAQALFGSGGATDFTWYTTGTTSGNIRQDSVALDDYGRFFDQYYCIRDSVVASTNSGSVITTNQPEVLHVFPTPDWSAAATCTQSPVTSYTTAMKNNGSTDVFKLANINTTAQRDILNTVVMNQSAEYILLTFDSRTNKIFFNSTNYANGLISDLSTITSASGLKVAGVEYLHIENSGNKKQNVFWKPVEFKDTTRIEREYRDTSEDKYQNYHNSFAKSGFIEFSMPIDWDAISITNLCGGVYNTASGNYAACTAAGFDDVTFQPTAITNVAGGSDGYGDKITLTLDASAQTAISAIGNADDVGRFKYICMVSGAATASGSSFWVASGAANGWNGTDKLNLQVGTTGTSATNANYAIPANADVASLRFGLRRVNVYDIINGAEKVFSDDGVIGATGNAELITVGGEDYNAGTSFFKNLYNAVDSTFTGSSWATNDKYVLKLTLSGTTSAGTSGNPCPELWNVFDANQGHSAIIKSEDDSAYNLNTLAITSTISVGRRGQYFKAITHRGKVFVTKTGVALTEVGFSSVALGDEYSSTAFDDHGPSTLYGHLHTIRKIQAEAVPVYWDEQQKDGTYVRLWGTVSDVNESRGVGGPRATMNYTFTLIVEKIALLTDKGLLMSDIYPLGGLPDEYTYS